MVLGFERADLYTAPVILGNMPLVVPPNAVLRQPEFLRQRGVTGTRGQKEIEPPTIRMPTCSALAIRPYRPPRRTPPHRSLPHQVSTTPALAKAFTRASARRGDGARGRCVGAGGVCLPHRGSAIAGSQSRSESLVSRIPRWSCTASLRRGIMHCGYPTDSPTHQ